MKAESRHRGCKRSSRSLLSIATGFLAIAALAMAVALVVRPVDRGEMALRDDEGRVRLRMYAADDGGGIELLDKNGRRRGVLRQDGERSVLELRSDASHESSVEISIDRSGLPAIAVRNAKACAKLGADAEGGEAVLGGPSGQATLSSGKRGNRLDLKTPADDIVASFVVAKGEKAQGHIGIQHKAGGGFSISTDEASTSFQMASTSRDTIVMMANRAGARVSLFDPKRSEPAIVLNAAEHAAITVDGKPLTSVDRPSP